MKCNKCKDKAVARNGKYCRVCYEAIVYKERSKKVPSPCKKCGEDMMVEIRKKIYYENRGGPTCRKCRSIISSETMKQTMSKMSKKERQKNGAYGSSKADHKKGVQKQWDNIKSDPVKYKEVCAKRSENLIKVWANMSDEEKNRRVKLLLSSHGKGRSKVNELLKEEMIKEEIYDGFQSEEVFHGFVPDEINHKLKIIVEMFGDTYHCNPKKFNDPCVFVKTIDRTVGDQWQRDKRRLGCFYKHGYVVVIVWESDFRKNPRKEVSRIENKINERLQ